MAKNAFLEFTDEQSKISEVIAGHPITDKVPTVKRKALYVTKVEQPLQLTGSTAQSRVTRVFYPRSFAPGDITVTGQCQSQTELQQLALFVRTHQLALLNTPSDEMFVRLDTTSPGYNRLMKLYVEGEQLSVRGFIPKFTITKKGVFEPAPTFSFGFTVIFDPHSSDFTLSRAISRQYNSPDQSLISKGGVAETPNDANVDIRDILGPDIPGFPKTPGDD